LFIIDYEIAVYYKMAGSHWGISMFYLGFRGGGLMENVVLKVIGCMDLSINDVI
jgi:hypothetical protein